MGRNGDVTPIRQQYLDIKSQYPDAILFFRLGDFYETFDEDAKTAARVLDIVLTSRNVAKGKRVPMAGIPHHAAESYIGKLIDRGYHVAICEQIGDGPVKGLFPREVVRVVTPGTIIEPGLIPSEANNYLAAVVLDDCAVGVAYVDITTGEFAATQWDTPDPAAGARQELERLRPAEVLLSDEIEPAEVLLSDEIEAELDSTAHTTRRQDWRFGLERTTSSLQSHFGVSSLDGFGLRGMPNAVRAAGAILDYLEQTQPSALSLLNGIVSYSTADFMVLDAVTRRNLELVETLRRGERTGSLLAELDRTVTPMGRRLLQTWIMKPLLELEHIQRRLDQVESFHADGLWRAEVRQALDGLGDLERLANRAASGTALPRDLASMREILQALPPLFDILRGGEAVPIDSLLNSMDPCRAVRAQLEKALTDEPPATLGNLGVIRSGYSERLDQVAESSRAARQWISNLEASERERTGIKSLKVGFNKVFGYYIEVTKANAEAVPDDYIRKQTLVNAERYITPEMKDYESQVLTAEEEMKLIEAQVFDELCQSVAESRPSLLGTARILARLDVVSALAEVAILKRYVRPILVEEPLLAIQQGRHPVVEQHLEDHAFVPNDSSFDQGEIIRIITGPNMSGKSTYLRQVALIVLMAQIGSFVPAEAARIGVADRIFTRIGAQDEIHAGQSTFMVEMVETANILHNATQRSLLILDEIGRGTSTYDGLSIAWAVVEYLHNHPKLRARTLFATHYHELTRLADQLPGVSNFNVAVADELGKLVFLHKIMPGAADESYGIHVGKIAGLPQPVIRRAGEILESLEEEAAKGPTAAEKARQLSFLQEGEPVLAEIRRLEIESLTPLDALNKLYELKKRLDGKD
jgi:DNA mismatch repair protein MutS